MTPLLSHDANTSTSGITQPESHIAPHFSYFNIRNAMVPLIMSVASHAASAGACGVN